MNAAPNYSTPLVTASAFRYASNVSGPAQVRARRYPETTSTANPKNFLVPAIISLFIAALLMGCGSASNSGSPVQVIGNLSSNEVVQIEEKVRLAIALKLNSASGHPTKSIEVATNGTVKVWYAAKESPWGEGGYVLVRDTNGWRITSELFR